MKVIGIDMDGVIVSLVPPTIEKLNERFGVEAEVKNVGRYAIEDAYEDLGVNKVLVEKYMYHMWSQRGFWLNLPPYRGAVSTIKKLADHYTVAIITRLFRQGVTCGNEKYEWLKKRFNDQMKERAIQFFCVGSAHKSLVNADLLVDDGIPELQEFMDAGKVGVVYDQPWNQGFDAHYRVRNWKEIEELIFNEEKLWQINSKKD